MNKLPPVGRLMALDVGTKRIGVAMSDESRLVATPKMVLNRQSNQKDFTKIKNLIDENKVVAIIVGLPFYLNGRESEMTQFVKKFSENFDVFLKKTIPFFFADESLTSFEARKIAASPLSRQKNFCDDIAASLILENFLYQINLNHAN